MQSEMQAATCTREITGGSGPLHPFGFCSAEAKETILFSFLLLKWWVHLATCSPDTGATSISGPNAPHQENKESFPSYHAALSVDLIRPSVGKHESQPRDFQS